MLIKANQVKPTRRVNPTRKRGSVSILPRLRVGLTIIDLAKHQIDSQAAFARLLILVTHIAAGVSERLDRGIKIDAMARCNLVGGDHEGDPGFHSTKGT